MSIFRQNRYRQALTAAGVYAAIATCFFIPLSTSLMDFFALAMVACWLFSGKIVELPQLLKRSPVASVATLLFLLFVIGIFYSHANLPYILDYFKKYRKLIYIPIVISLFEHSPKARKNAEYSFITGCIILLVISCAMRFHLLPDHKYGDSILFHITHSFFMAILAFWSAHFFMESKQYRYFWLFLFIATVFNSIYIAPGRTGMFILIVLLLLFTAQRLSIKKQAIGLMLLCFFIAGAFYTSHNFSSRLHEAWYEVMTYKHGSSRTSLGQRLDWWSDSLELIKKKPIFGYGTGDFAEAQGQLIQGTKTEPTDNPHNEYLFITVQLGIVGLFALLALFVSQWICSFKLHGRDRYLVQGVVVSMVVGCCMNSFLFDTHPGHFYAVLSGIFFAATPHCPMAFKRLT